MTNEELYRQYLSGDAEAFERLYLQMQGFIASVAKDAAQSFGCSDKEILDELCAEGALELCECLSTGAYDEARGKLTTYLHPFLRGKMYRYLEANLGAAALPKDEMQRVKQAQRLHKEEMLPLDEVAQTLGVSEEKAVQLIGYETKALSVSAFSNDDSDDDPLAWLLLDQHALTPEQAVYRQVCTEELEQLFRTLSAKFVQRFFVCTAKALRCVFCNRSDEPLHLQIKLLKGFRVAAEILPVQFFVRHKLSPPHAAPSVLLSWTSYGLAFALHTAERIQILGC